MTGVVALIFTGGALEIARAEYDVGKIELLSMLQLQARFKQRAPVFSSCA